MSKRQEFVDIVEAFCDKKNLFPKEITEIILSFHPYSFPIYSRFLSSSGLHVISSIRSSPRRKMIKEFIRCYKKHNFVPIVFSSTPSFFSEIDEVVPYSLVYWDDFIERVQNDFVTGSRTRTKYVVFMDLPEKQFLEHCSWNNIVFHGGNLLLPIYLATKVWDDIPVAVQIVVDDWFTREKTLWGKQDGVDTVKEIKELLRSQENAFLVQESNRFNEKPDLFWISSNDLIKNFNKPLGC